MKILTIAGTRPELIRLSIILKKLDDRCDHRFLWTGQNFTPELSDIFFEEFKIRKPNYLPRMRLGDDAVPTLAAQLGDVFYDVQAAILDFRPDKALILGDTNSALSAIICERLGVPVYHMEAGNRCYDPKVPEEKNRRIIDAVSAWALPYTPGSRDNLLAEGIPRNRIHVCGNPIWEVMKKFPAKGKSRHWDNYFLATFHRQENVDNKERLEQIFLGLDAAARRLDVDVICSIHPRTRQRIEQFEIEIHNPRIRLMAPFGFRDFLGLEQHAFGVFTDSGTVQEECCIFRVPTVTIRDTTERPETVACGSNIVSGLKAENIDNCMTAMLQRPKNWTLPTGYGDPHVSEKVLEILDV